MRILYFSREYTSHDRRFLAAIAGRGYEAHFLALEPDRTEYRAGPLPAGIHRADQGSLTELARTSGQSLEACLGEIIDAARPDLIMAGPIPTCAALVAKCGFTPLVAVSWGSDVLVDSVRDPRARASAHVALAGSSLIVCDNAAVERALSTMSSDGLPPILTFPWGALPQWFVGDDARAREWRAAAGWTDAVIVLAARAWHEGYGVEDVVGAFALAAKEMPSLRLALAGDGPAAALVRERIAESGVDHKIRCLGHISEDDVSMMCHTADIYCAATPSDGTSVTLLQALAAGLPVVVTDNVANREWVSPGENGFLSPAGDVRAFAQHLVSLAGDPQKAVAMGARGRSHVRARADWEGNVGAMLAAFTGLVSHV